MVKLEEFQDHLQTIKQEDWDRFFAKLQEIEEANSFGDEVESQQNEDGTFSFPYWNNSFIVDDICSIINELQLAPSFDWNSWKEGRLILESKDFDFTTLDTFTLCKFFTTIIRANRFMDGYLVYNFENGNVFKIISAIKQNQLFN
jgi:hypothetical protein